MLRRFLNRKFSFSFFSLEAYLWEARLDRLKEMLNNSANKEITSILGNAQFRDPVV